MSYTDAITTRTEAEVRIDLSEEIAARGGDDTSFPETSTARKLLDVDAAARAREEELRAQAVRAGSTELVEEIPEEDGRDGWIEHLSLGTYGLERDPATKARHRVVYTNAATGLQRTIKPGTQRARAGAVEFVNIEVEGSTYAGGGTLAPGGTLELLFEATTAGSAGNVSTGTIRQLVTAIAGVSIDNPAISGQGSSIVKAARDAERNASLLDRDRARWGATSAGGSVGSLVEWIGDAFAFAGLAKTVTKWFVDDTNAAGPGTTTVHLANDSGPATDEEVATVQAYYDLRRAAGTGPLVARKAVTKAVSFAGVLKNGTNAAAESEAQAVIAALNAETSLGLATLYRAEVIERLMAVRGMVNVVLDLEDIALEPGENLVLTATFTVVP